MIGFEAAFTSIRDFFEAGGNVLWGILFVTILMWTFIIERYWYFLRVHPQRIKDTIKQWQARTDHTSWYARRVRDMMISQVSVETNQYIIIVKTAIVVLPLLGLLGTVTGMVQVFDVMAVLGTGNARAMASGVSAATIPTMSGMVAAISGIFFGSALERQANNEVEKIADVLRHY